MPRLGAPKTGGEVACPNCGKLVYRARSAMGKKACSMACRDVINRGKRVKDGQARCARCRTWKPLASFVKGVGGRPHSYCKPCHSEWFHERRGTPKEERSHYRPAYKLSDEEKRANKREANRRQHMARRASGPKPHKFDLGRMLCIQDDRCAYCRRPLGTTYHVDHKHPVSRGGTNDLSNLHLTCPRCNMRKGAMTHEEFLVSKKRPVVSWDEPDTLEALA